MSLKKLFFITCIFILSLGMGCFGPGTGPGQNDTGTLVLNMTFDDYASSSQGTATYLYKSDGINYTILPPIDMAPVSYDIHGVGPDGETFDVSTDQGSITIEDLAFGDWTITVYARNSIDTIIGEGSAPATINVNQTTTVDVTVGPLDGFGNLSLTVTWNGDDTQTPSIEAQLIPYTGATYNLDFPITNGDTGTYDSTMDTTNFPEGIPDGYYTLTVKLYDGTAPNKVLTMGAVEVVRIVKDQTTTGSFDFPEINAGTGDIIVNIDVDMEDPLTVTMTGQTATINQGESMTVSASVDSSVPALSGNATYVWYINGETKDTGETVTLGSDLAVGVYRLDVTAYSVDGTRAGSATYMFHVEEGSAITGPLYGWTKKIGGVNNEIGYSIVTDISGNIYLIGTFLDTVNFGQGWGETDSKTYTGGRDIFVTKINADGSYSWTRQIGGTYLEDCNSISTDQDGNVYITGDFMDTVNFQADWGGTDSKTSADDLDMFVTKINADGSYGWTKRIGSEFNDSGISITTDQDGNVYATGYFRETVNFQADWGGTDNKTLAGIADTFVTKINADGSYGWTRRIGGQDFESGNSITTDHDNNVYVTGYFSDTVNFQADWGGTDSKTSAGSNDIFLTKINADGSYGWTRRIGSVFSDKSNSISTDQNGNVYVAGYFMDTVNFQADWGGTDSKTSAGSSDIFLTKINADGSYGWTRQIGDTTSDHVHSISTDQDGNVYATGVFANTINFQADWGGTDSKTSVGYLDIFLTKINADGSYGWTRRIGSTGSDYGNSITNIQDGTMYVTGYFQNIVNFGEDFGETDIKTSTGEMDAFITKINIQ